ncbi:Nitrogenase [Methanocaldococcus infernus ME]|uniref:Nitrogenase n=1 Tax=Methanocaldococcus infernus (strain DSM 11812 / JCM 15783 / ME) TaxID=573063 RepID=D5VUB4_METIM|nr:AAA family ATPase [Methanocaldococcus infernus]ADG12726.1 Nitrogenase [Methanocaldococcus infernus ME]
MKQIGFYGKGGIGKSTTVCNIAKALSEEYRVLVIGCDPKADCTALLREEDIKTVLEVLREKRSVKIEDIVVEGGKNIYCVEAGGPKPGVGCAGRGVIVAIETLKKLNVFENLDIDIVLYDILGDVVCGGFSLPLRFLDDVYIITSSDYMSLYAANNIAMGVKELKNKLSGVIYNVRGSYDNEEVVKEFCKRINTNYIGKIPNSPLVAKSEVLGKTVIEAFPDSDIAKIYKELARKIYENREKREPMPLSKRELKELALKYLK